MALYHPAIWTHPKPIYLSFTSEQDGDAYVYNLRGLDTPPGLLDSFQATIESIVEQLRTLTFANQKLRTARDLLLPRLMSGEIAV